MSEIRRKMVISGLICHYLMEIKYFEVVQQKNAVNHKKLYIISIFLIWI